MSLKILIFRWSGALCGRFRLFVVVRPRPRGSWTQFLHETRVISAPNIAHSNNCIPGHAWRPPRKLQVKSRTRWSSALNNP